MFAQACRRFAGSFIVHSRPEAVCDRHPRPGHGVASVGLVSVASVLAVAVGGAGVAVADTPPGVLSSSSADVSAPPVGGREVPQLRTERSVTWLKPDGLYVTRVFQQPVSYPGSDGSWRPIDTHLVAAAGGGWRNRAGRYSLSVPASLSDGPLRLAVGQGWLSFRLRDAAAAPGRVSGSEATFAGAAGGVSASWTALNNGVKEQLVLANVGAAHSFSFDVGTSSGLTLGQGRGGGAEVVDASGDAVFDLPAPFAVDAAGVRAPRDAVRMSVAASAGGGATLSVSVNPAWLDAASRRFPVTIDPSVNLYPGRDCMIESDTPDTGHCDGQNLWVGWSDIGAPLHDHRALLSFDPSAAVPEGSELLNARMWMWIQYQSDDTVAKQLSVHRLTAAWDGDVSWSHRTAASAWGAAGGDYAATAEASRAVGDTLTWMHWDVTKAVQGWLDGSFDNDGLVVVDDSAQANNEIGFDSTEWGDPDAWPYLELEYYPRAGDLPGYTFDTQQLSDRQSLSVNVANGNLLLRSQDLQVAGRGLDLNVDRYFNSLDPWDGQLGWGARFGLGGDIVIYDCDWDNPDDQCYVGPSGIRAHFIENPDGSFRTPNGINATLVRHADGTRTLTDHHTGEQFHFPDGQWQPMTSWNDRHGNTLHFYYDGDGVLHQITDTRGRDIAVTRNPSIYVAKLTDPTGREWTYGYNATSDLLTSVTDPDGHETDYGHDGQGRLTTITDARGTTTTIGYDAGNRVHTVTRQIDDNRDDDLTNTYEFGTANATCDQSSEIGSTVLTDPRGNATTYCWNKSGRVVRTIDAAGYERARTYTPNGDADSFTDLTGTAAATSTFDFDTSGSDPTNNLQGGSFGAGEQFTVGYCDPGATSGPTQCNSYPQNKYQPTSLLGPDHNRYFGYNASGDLTSVTDSTTSPTNQAILGYNDDGTIHTATDGKGQVTTFGYSSDGELTSVTPNSATGTNALKETAYTYDSLSRVVTVKDGRHAGAGYEIADIDYDGEDRVTQLTFGDGSWISFCYDGDGNLISRSDSGGNETDYSYDRSNRRTSEILPGASNSYGYDGSGNLASITDASGSVTYRYDAADRVDQITQPDASQLTFTYSGPTVRPRWTKLTYPGGTTQTTYTDGSRKTTLIEVKNSSGSTLRSLTYDYTSSGQRTQVHTVTEHGGDITTYTYDSVGRLKQAETKTSGGTLVERWTYTYDNASNRTRVDHTTGSGTTITSYGYNSDNVLCWRSTGGASSSDCGNPPTGADSYTYDDSGNQTAGSSSFSAVYDIANRLTTLNGASLSYLSPTNSELESIGGTTLTNNVLGVASHTTTGSTTYYTRAPDGTLLAQRSASGTQYAIDDNLGSTRGLFTATSSGIDRDYSYDPDGNATSTGSGATTTIKFAGGLDVGSGLYHYGLRYYDSNIGRWIEPDPLRQDTDLQEANSFAYVGGDPINNVDPGGDSWVDKWIDKRFHAGEKFLFSERLKARAALGRFGKKVVKAGSYVQASEFVWNCSKTLSGGDLAGQDQGPGCDPLQPDPAY